MLYKTWLLNYEEILKKSLWSVKNNHDKKHFSKVHPKSMWNYLNIKLDRKHKNKHSQVGWTLYITFSRPYNKYFYTAGIFYAAI